ncbi:putative quinol monooxygenase [Flectobacillus major]|uniref:putative quinol monooxygenase n=1 Tax=Flectobacillus major TaxID=103 RepID=UPI000418CF54|nr:putative quinol monooxygenase [Flectobacillus major]
MLTVIAKITALKGKEEEAKAALQGLVAPTLVEEGCIDYVLHQSNDDATIFYFYENWESQQHLDKHLVNDHLVAFGAIAGSLLAGPAELSFLTKLS